MSTRTGVNVTLSRHRECQERLGMTHKEDRMSTFSPSCLVSHSGRMAASLGKRGRDNTSPMGRDDGTEQMIVRRLAWIGSDKVRRQTTRRCTQSLASWKRLGLPISDPGCGIPHERRTQHSEHFAQQGDTLRLDLLEHIVLCSLFHSKDLSILPS